jgi:molecular chaperone GrpE
MNESKRKPETHASSPSAEPTDDYPVLREQGEGSAPAAGGDAEPVPGQGGLEAPNGERLSASEQIAQLKQERDEFRDQALRSRAEFANYQKRAKQQADADRVYAIVPLARDLLEPIDNLERAIEALRASSTEGVTTGLDMVQKQLLDILAKHGVEPIPAQGHPFDPHLHDAVAHQPSADHPEGTVIAELSKGYTIRDRVLRPSKVAVAAKPMTP